MNGFFSVFIDDCVVFNLSFPNVVCYMNYFLVVYPPLHSRNKLYFILLELVNIFVEFCIYVHEGFCHFPFLSDLLSWWHWPYNIGWEMYPPPAPPFYGRVCGVLVLFLYPCIKFNSETILARGCVCGKIFHSQLNFYLTSYGVRFSISSWICFGNLWLSRNLFHLSCHICWHRVEMS